MLYHPQFLTEYDFPEREPEKFLIIASTPRCGSHMLGHVLHQTGRFGFPLEYAQPANLAEWARLCGTSDAEATLRAVARRRTSENGVFSIKLHYSHIEPLGGVAQVQRLFPNASFVLLSRQDVLRQAVSLAIAGQTGVWIDGQEPKSCAPPVYDYEQIDRCLRRVLKDNAAWRYLMAATGCRFLDLDFDGVREDLAGTVERIARFADIPMADVEVPEAPVTRRQSNALNDEWVQRFIAERPERVLFPTSEAGHASSWQRQLRGLLARARRGLESGVSGKPGNVKAG